MRTFTDGRIYYGTDTARTASGLWRDGDLFIVEGTGALYRRVAGAWVALTHGELSGLTSGDPHTQYLLASAATDRTTFAANWTDLTDGGVTTLHTHGGGDTGWQTLTPDGSWSTAGTYPSSGFTHGVVGYRVLNGVCYLRGSADCPGSSPGDLMTLPVGARPATDRAFITRRESSSTLGYVCCYILTDGSVRFDLNSSGYTYHLGLSFPV